MLLAVLSQLDMDLIFGDCLIHVARESSERRERGSETDEKRDRDEKREKREERRAKRSRVESCLRTL